MSAILAALKQGDLQNVVNLIQQGLNLDTKDENGVTPLQYSIENGHTNIVKLLLVYGADPNIENCAADNEEDNMATANNKYKYTDENQIIEQIIDEIKNLKSTTAMHTAIKRNDLESLKLLLEYGADPNVLDLGNCTPLHWAATKGNLAAVKILLDAKIDPNLQDLAKSTALHEAVRKKNKKIIEILIKNGADPNLADISGHSAYDLVAEQQQLLDVILLNSHNIPAGCAIH